MARAFITPLPIADGFLTYIGCIAVNSAGLFVAVGMNLGISYIITSTDGSTWSPPVLMFSNSTPYNTYVHGIAVNNAGLFVGVGNDSILGPVYTRSPNGITWSNPVPIPATGFNPTGITVNAAGLFVAVGMSQYSLGPVFITSTDGATWTNLAYMGGFNLPVIINGIAVNETGLFVAVGYSSFDQSPLYTTSSNGSTWTTPTLINGYTTPTYMNSITFDPTANEFVAVGDGQTGDGTNGTPYYATSPDGSTWTTPAASINAPTTFTSMQGLTARADGLIVGVGQSVVGGGSYFAVYTNNAIPVEVLFVQMFWKDIINSKEYDL